MSQPNQMPVTREEAQVMREAMMADPVAARELMEAGDPGHRLRMRELRELNRILHGKPPANDQEAGDLWREMMWGKQPASMQQPDGAKAQAGTATALLQGARPPKIDLAAVKARREAMMNDAATRNALVNQADDKHAALAAEWASLGEQIFAAESE